MCARKKGDEKRFFHFSYTFFMNEMLVFFFTLSSIIRSSEKKGNVCCVQKNSFNYDLLIVMLHKYSKAEYSFSTETEIIKGEIL